MKTIQITLLISLMSFGVNAQNINYAGVFPTIDHSLKYNEKWSSYAYLFSAIKPYKSLELDQKDKARALSAYAELGMNYQINTKLSATASYVYQRSEPFETYYTNENRLFQQLTLKLPFNKFELKQRLRFDERFIQNNIIKKTDFKHRLRYLIGGKFTLSSKYYLMGYVELFFDTKNKFKYSENWSAFQLGYNFNKQNSLEIGYLYTGWIRNNNNDWLNQHYLQITWVNQISLNKK